MLVLARVLALRGVVQTPHKKCVCVCVCVIFNYCFKCILHSWISAPACIPSRTRKVEHRAQRIYFKILLLASKSLNGLAPKYIKDLLSLYQQLRSSKSRLLIIPKLRTKHWEAAFISYAPLIWNKPPDDKAAELLRFFKLRI